VYNHANTDKPDLHMRNHSAQSFLEPSTLQLSKYARALPNEHHAFASNILYQAFHLFFRKEWMQQNVLKITTLHRPFFHFINGISAAADVSMGRL
jgi:hypothetical protein